MRAETTLELTLDLATLDGAALPATTRAFARLSLFDWMVVARAGAQEPVSRIVRDLVEAEGGRPLATLVGTDRKAPPRAAALANGTISHALDYDDTHFAHVGHPSVAILPAALAVAEAEDAPAARVAEAFAIGAEASCRIGLVLGRRHYERGFHQTATAGAFGATVAAGRLLGLDRDRMRQALSLVSTRASGLKSQFGTMGKPYNAGSAASNGVEAALLASAGFVSAADGLGGSQGFVDTHAETAEEAQAWADPPPGTFLFDAIQYKLHACCHGTHAMLEALAEAGRARALAADAIEHVALRVNPRWLGVCDIKAPRTGLEAKFSYGLLAAMAISGIDTASDRVYTEALCRDARLQALAGRVTVTGDAAVPDTATRLEITLASGETLAAAYDLAQRRPADEVARSLRAKAAGLLGADAAERLWAAVEGLDRLSARDLACHLGAPS